MSCLICGYDKLEFIGSFGDVAISNFTDTPEGGDKYPLTLVYCPECTLLQLREITPRDKLYSNYWYKSGINPKIVADLKEISGEVVGPRVCDIGANDGTLLSFLPSQYSKVGVEPSNIQPKGVTWVRNYWEDVDLAGAKFDTITAIAMLYDLPYPNKFIQNIVRHLAYDGRFIAQLMTLKPMVENNDVGNICHEHIEFYSYKALKRLFEQNGLEIYKVELNDMNGGSYRIFSRRYQNGSVDFAEKEYDVRELKNFIDRIEWNKRCLTDWLYGKKVYGYGASTKANTILQYYGVGPKAIVDINPLKVGKYTVNSGVPVISDIPDDCEYLWVFPYGFLDYFKQKETGYKGKWVTTIPEFRII